jgi:rhodanese-related sulfurtransferase
VTRRTTVHDLLAAARARYRRIGPAAAFDAVRRGALVIDRTVLEWRVDPASGAPHPAISGLDAPMILICDQGYSSSLAVASLLDLGASDVTDVVGGSAPGRRLAFRSSADGRLCPSSRNRQKSGQGIDTRRQAEDGPEPHTA